MVSLIKHIREELQMLREYTHAVVDDEGYEHDRYKFRTDAEWHVSGDEGLRVVTRNGLAMYVAPIWKHYTGKIR